MRNCIEFLCLVVAALVSMNGYAGGLYVISNTSVNLTAAEVRDVFLGEKQFSGSVKLTPVDNSAAQTAFLQQVLQMDADKYASIWAKRSFRDGMNPPEIKSSDAEVIGFVKGNPGAVGYVTVPTDGVKVMK